MSALFVGGCITGEPSLEYQLRDLERSLPPATNTVDKASADKVAERLLLMEQRMAELSSRLGSATSNPGVSARPEDGGRLLELQRKSVQCDAFALELRERNREKEALTAELETARAADVRQREEMTLLRRQTNELTRATASLRGELEPLKEMLRVLRLGHYEYYTIQPNDTCETIAAQPMVYGDAAKNSVIRQMNRGLVADLDRLTAGDVLLIPRLEGVGRHDF